MQDEVAGEVPVAFVVSSEGSQVTEDDVTSYICKQVRFKIPLSVFRYNKHTIM